MLPDAPKIDVGSEAIMDGTESRKAAALAFLEGLAEVERSGIWTGGSFSLSDLYHDDDGELEPEIVIKVSPLPRLQVRDSISC